jgi:ribonuclease VapC
VKYVVDASAALAYLKGESSIEALPTLLAQGIVSTINLAEVGDYYAQYGHERSRIADMISALGMAAMPLDSDLALDAALLKPSTRSIGASLADRCCLALARRLNLPALTGDRKWAEISEAVGVEIVLIR